MNSDQQQQRIMGYFIEEAREHLHTIEQGVLNLQDLLDDAESINELFRAAHSIKGGAAMLGVGSIQHIAHRLEDFFKIIKDHPQIKVDERLKSLLLAGFDPLAELLDELQMSYKISDDLSQETTGRVKPVFVELERYLDSLTNGSGAVENAAKESTEKVSGTKVISAPVKSLQVIFQQEVTTKMRDMLQVFRGEDTDESRSQLQSICDHFLAIAQDFDLPSWENLVVQIKSAIAITSNSFRDLAPVVIRELKEAQDLVIANQGDDITVSSNLQALLPYRPTQTEDDEISTIFTTAPAYFENEVPETQELTDSDVLEDFDVSDVSAESDTTNDLDLDFLDDLEPNLDNESSDDLSLDEDNLDLSSISTAPIDQLDWMEGDYETVDDQSVDGPMVGASELKSLAVLFENDDIDFESAWEDIESNETQIARQNIDDSSASQDDFADLLVNDTFANEDLGGFDMGKEDQSLGVDHLFGDFDTDESTVGNLDQGLDSNLNITAHNDANSLDAPLNSLDDNITDDNLFPDDLMTEDWGDASDDIPLDVDLNVATIPPSPSSLDALFNSELGDEDLLTETETSEMHLEDNSHEVRNLFDCEDQLFPEEFNEDGANLDVSEDIDTNVNQFLDAQAGEGDQDLGLDGLDGVDEPFALTSLEDGLEFLGDLDEPFAIDAGDESIQEVTESANLDQLIEDNLENHDNINNIHEINDQELWNNEESVLDFPSDDSQQGVIDDIADLSNLFGDETEDIPEDQEINRVNVNNVVESDLGLDSGEDLDDFFAASEEAVPVVNDQELGDLALFDDALESQEMTLNDGIDSIDIDVTTSPSISPSMQSNSIEDLDDFFSMSEVDDTEAITFATATAYTSPSPEHEDFGDRDLISATEQPEIIGDLTSDEDWAIKLTAANENDLTEIETNSISLDSYREDNSAQDYDLDSLGEADDLEQLDATDRLDIFENENTSDSLSIDEWFEEDQAIENNHEDSWMNDESLELGSNDNDEHDLDQDVFGLESDGNIADINLGIDDAELSSELENEQFLSITDTDDDLIVDEVTAETTLDSLVDFFQGDDDENDLSDAISVDLENVNQDDPTNGFGNSSEDNDDLTFAEEDRFVEVANDVILQPSELLRGDGVVAEGVAELNGIDDNFDFDDLEAMIDMDVAESSHIAFDNGNNAGSEQTNDIDFDDLEALLGDSGTPDQPLEIAKDDTDATIANESQPKPADDFGELEDMLHSTFAKDVGQIQTKAPSKPAAASRKQKLADTTMRVDVKYLDSLNNLVGELVVNRNLLEQEQERLQQFITNLLHQVQLLSDVSQRMRDQYDRSLLEASLSAGRGKQHSFESIYANDGGSDGGLGSSSVSRDFEGIEFDRYNTFHVLSQEIIELIVRVRESASDIEFVVGETDQVTRQLGTITTQVQDDLKQSRMVPFAQIADRLPRGVRDRSLKTGKQVDLEVFGRETLIDKAILESLTDPLTHLVNNAIDHGLEDPATRQAMGKSATGKLTVRAYHQGNQTVISISDDGAGIDPAKVKKSAVSKGVRTQAEVDGLSDNEVYGLLFEPGFSTAAKADEFKGRGVGLDVVKTCLDEIRGVIIVESAIGKGTSFIIRLPLTLSISKAMFCISDRARIAFPVDGFEDMVEVPQSQIILNEKGQPCLPWRDTVLPFQHLSNLLSYNRHLSRSNIYGKQENDELCIIILRNDTNYLALQVDQFLGEYEIVIKQLEGPIPQPAGVAGATVLGDGRVMAIANVLELFDIASGRLRPSATNVPMQPVVEEDVAVDPTVLIVDDSITVRELLSLTFAKVGYRVEQAKDGQDAWEKLRAGLPCDMIFCDIEMPRMDGLDLLSRLQKDSRLKQIPVAMLTSRGADRHRQSAIQLGAKGYFTKPYLEEELLSASKRLLNGETLPI
ncbi:MAG: response regulator [Pseudanabaenaceae cyanobacterium bins.39]|nr:response regulator [Pseudanabaenaceae cyanobacterium bins.39]